jgi:hypothetical protein
MRGRSLERTGATIYALGVNGRGVMRAVEILCEWHEVRETVATEHG